MIKNNDIEDLLIKECYRGVATKSQKQVDKNCLTADILTYKCESPIDAAAFIGVTFDITKGYSQGEYKSHSNYQYYGLILFYKVYRGETTWPILNGLKILNTQPLNYRINMFMGYIYFLTLLSPESKPERIPR